MRSQKLSEHPGQEILSIYGPLRAIFIPSGVAARNPADIGRALIQRDFRLSEDELRLLEYVAFGLTNGEIAELLGADWTCPQN
jgi:DNA-binding NarL/FixJ family response regulator